MTDWKDASRNFEIRIMMVDPHNLDIDRGELTDLILSGCSISYGYYTDTRVSAKLQTLGSNYIDGSWLRIRLISDDYAADLGTFVLQDDPDVEEKNGEEIYTYDLQSVLWALSNDMCSGHFAIGSGSYALDVFNRVCGTCGKVSIKKAGTRNYRYTDSRIYDIAETYQSILYDICEASNNRLDIDGHGRITIEPYLSPSQITPAWTVDADDPRTLLLSAGVTTTSDSHTVIGRAIVVYKSGETEITATADRKSTSPYSASQRGYMITRKYQVDNLTPATTAAAQALAEKYLTESEASVTTKASFLYFPCQCGETLYLIRDGTKRKYLIQSIDPLNLKNMTMELTLKEV